MQKSIFPQKIQKSLCITTKSLYTNSKFQTQFSRKLQRFRTCRKNKKCSIFHDLSEYIIFSYDCNLLDWSFNLFFSNGYSKVTFQTTPRMSTYLVAFSTGQLVNRVGTAKDGTSVNKQKLIFPAKNIFSRLASGLGLVILRIG